MQLQQVGPKQQAPPARPVEQIRQLQRVESARPIEVPDSQAALLRQAAQPQFAEACCCARMGLHRADIPISRPISGASPAQTPRWAAAPREGQKGQNGLEAQAAAWLADISPAGRRLADNWPLVD